MVTSLTLNAITLIWLLPLTCTAQLSSKQIKTKQKGWNVFEKVMFAVWHGVSKLNKCDLGDLMDKSVHFLWSIEKWLHFKEFWEVFISVVKNSTTINYAITWEKAELELKVHIFWEGLKILPLTFFCMYCRQKLGGDFTKFCGLLRIYEL